MDCPNVITNVELERMAARGPIARPSDGKPAKSVLFMQCAGSRDQDHLAYCSSVCCMTTLKQADYLREQDSAAEVFVIYRDMRTPGTLREVLPQGSGPPAELLHEGQGNPGGGDGRRPGAGKPRQ